MIIFIIESTFFVSYLYPYPYMYRYKLMRWYLFLSAACTVNHMLQFSHAFNLSWPIVTKPPPTKKKKKLNQNFRYELWLRKHWSVSFSYQRGKYVLSINLKTIKLLSFFIIEKGSKHSQEWEEPWLHQDRTNKTQ